MAEITKDTYSSRSSIGRAVFLPFIALVIFTYFFGLTIPLLGPDEPRYAQVAREMFERGDWVTPTLGGFPWFEKPALLYWLEIISYKLFGVSEFSARFGSAVFGLATILFLWILGSKWTTKSAEDNEPNNDLPKWLVLVSASTLGLLVFARGASFDMILTFPITAALVSFFVASIARTRSFRAYYLPLGSFYFFVGISLIAKGLVGIVFPFAIVAFYFVLLWRFPSKELIFSFFWGTVIWIGIAAVWYVPVYLQNGYRFIDEFIIQHHFQRYTSNRYQHPQPFYFFLWVLPLMTLPWLPFFFAAIWSLVRTLVSRRKSIQTQTNKPLPRTFSLSHLQLFAIAWLLVPLIFFSFSGSKLPGYILPAVPAAVILTADFISRFTSSRPIWRELLIAGAFTTVIAVSLLIQFVAPTIADADSVRSLIAATGPSTDKIFCLHTLSHNAEFYGAGRLIRNSDGTQRRFNSVQEIVDEMKRAGLSESLVLMPIAYIKEMPVYNMIEATPIKDNGELAIVRFTLK